MVFFCELFDHFFESAAVGDGGVEQPMRKDVLFLQEVVGQGQGGCGFGDFSVGAVDAGDVFVCSVAAFEYDGAAHRGFNGDEEVVAVDEQFLACQFGGWDHPLSSAFELLVGAGVSHDG